MFTKELYETIRSNVLNNLDKNLSKDLLYHCVEHTIDVELQAGRIALSENITGIEELFLLKTACLYHDSGFLFTYRDHESAGCELVTKELPAYGLSSPQIEIVCGLITATKIPQTPLSPLEEIICDADLDYLGRDDFFPISNNLFLELKAKKFVVTENDWNLIQVNFFKQHTYFTPTTKNLREKQKQKHLGIIGAMIEKENIL